MPWNMDVRSQRLGVIKERVIQKELEAGICSSQDRLLIELSLLTCLTFSPRNTEQKDPKAKWWPIRRKELSELFFF